MSQFDNIRFQPSRPLLKELSADRLNNILAEIRRNKPRGERGITVRQSGDATYIGLAASVSGGTSTPTRRLPWDIYVTDTTGEAPNITYTLRVEPGTLGNFLATNWDQEFTATANALVYGVVTVSTDGFGIVSTEIAMQSGPPAPQTPLPYAVPGSVSYLFGLFKGGANYRIASQGNVPFAARLYMIKEKESAAAPGQSPYELFYQLAP